MTKSKLFFISVFFLTAVSVFAGTEYRDLCRKILYAVKPVEAIGKLDPTTFQNIRRFALGLPVEGQDPLNENDQRLMMFLYFCEAARRTKSADDFSLYLQDEQELLTKHIKEGDNLSIKMEGWLDLFKLNLIFSD